MKNTIPTLHIQITLPLFKFGALLLLIATLLGSSSVFATLVDYQAAVTNTSGLISYYTFDQLNVTDIVGTNNDGTAVYPFYATGPLGYGHGLLCEATNWVYFSTNDTAFTFPSGTGSIEAWVRADWSLPFSGYEPTLWADGSGYGTEYSVHVAHDKSGVGIWNGIGYEVLTTPSWSTNWHHLVTVFDASTFTVYMDGQLAAEEDKILGINPNEFCLGTSAPWGGEGWMGMLDEVAVYSVALDADTISAHYNALYAGTPPVIVKQPVGGTFLQGVTLTMAVSATGPSLTYQWFKGAGSLTGQTNTTLTLMNLSAGDADTYHVVVHNPGGDAPSTYVTVALGTLPAQVTRYQTAVSNEATLISFYTFDQLTANDVFGTNNGTLQGSATNAPAFASAFAGGASQGLLLDGNGQVNLGTVPSFDFTNSGNGSVEAWVRADWPATFSSYTPALFANRNKNTGLCDWSINMTANKQVVAIYNGTNSYLYAIPGGGAGTNWHHIAVVFNQTTNTVYWDSAAVLTTIGQPFGASPSTTQIGSSSPGSTTEGWIGMLDDIAFYSDALSAAQVQAHYNAFYQGLAPVISVQPASANLLVGSPFTMYAQAQGGQLAYQWYKNNTPIPGATSLTIGSASVAVTDTGVYYFTASNSVGVAWSSGAVLNVGNYIARYQAAVRSEPSLISYYTFDTSDATDSYGTNNGTAAGSGTITYTNGPGGVTNNSLVLNGSDWINLGQVSAFDFVSGGTAEAWIKTGWTSSWTTYGDAPCIFGDRDGGSVWDIHMDVGFHLIGNWNNDRFITLPVSNNASNTWHHYAVTFGGGLVSMYWDGQPLGTFNQAINFFCCETTQIGASDPSSPAQPWVGNLDEVAFYSSALSADAINNHYLAMVLPTPTISYSRSVSGITISWPLVYGTTYTLQSTASLSAPSWTPVGGVVSNSVTVTASPGSQFFRLVK